MMVALQQKEEEWSRGKALIGFNPGELPFRDAINPCTRLHHACHTVAMQLQYTNSREDSICLSSNQAICKSNLPEGTHYDGIKSALLLILSIINKEAK